jgi:hypothetical protein
MTRYHVLRLTPPGSRRRDLFLLIHQIVGFVRDGTGSLIYTNEEVGEYPVQESPEDLAAWIEACS